MWEFEVRGTQDPVYVSPASLSPLGMAPTVGGQTTNMHSQGGSAPEDVVCGAVQAVLAQPGNADVCFAGAVNGGDLANYLVHSYLARLEAADR
jgi:hypothetical protein